MATPLNIEAKLQGLVDQQEITNVLLAEIAANNGSLVVNSARTLQRLTRLGIIAKVLHPTDQVVIERETAMTINSSNNSLTVSVNADTFIEKIGTAHSGVYEFVFDGLVWKLHEEEVELDQYGITCTGTPSANDEIAVHETAAQLVFDVLGVDQDTPSDPNLTHSLTLQMHDCLQTLQFDAAEALMCFPNGLAAGTYHVTLDHGAYGGGTAEDGDYQFTTTQAIPNGGYLRHSTMGSWRSLYGKSYVVAGNFITYNADYTQIQSVATTEGTGGTKLGTVSANNPTYKAGSLVDADDIWYTEPQYAGYNNFEKSALRQMLDSKAAKGSVWTAQHKFDFPPSWRTTQDGFLKGLDPELVSVIGRVEKRTGLNPLDRNLVGENYVDTDELVWLPSFSEVYFGQNTYGAKVNEGEPYKYYSDYSDLTAAGTGADANRKKGVNGGAATYWWLRSPNPNDAYSVCYVDPTGAYTSYIANSRDGLAPAFCIV